jgi:hypothetical protein
LVHTGHSKSSWTLLAGVPAAFRLTLVTVLFETAADSVSDSVLEGVSPSRIGDSGISILTLDGAIPILTITNVKISKGVYSKIPDSLIRVPIFSANARQKIAFFQKIEINQLAN